MFKTKEVKFLVLTAQTPEDSNQIIALFEDQSDCPWKSKPFALLIRILFKVPEATNAGEEPNPTVRKSRIPQSSRDTLNNLPLDVMVRRAPFGLLSGNCLGPAHSTLI